MKKIQVFLLLCLCSVATSFAQTSGIAAFGEISGRGPQAGTAELFRMNPEQCNHRFDFILPNNGRLIVEFFRLSDWGTQNQLQAMAEAAAHQAKLLKDSFSSSSSGKLLALNIPVNNQIIAVQYQEDEKEKNQLAYKDGSYYQLKTSFDTIRVIKNMGIRTRPKVDSGLIRIQYTFILKDVNDIHALSDNPEILEKMGQATDSAIAKQRKRRHHQDASHHTLHLRYDPNAPQPMTSELEDDPAFSFFMKEIKLYLGAGFATYTGNAISPYFDETIAYAIPSRGRMQPYVGANMSVFGLLNINGRSTYYWTYGLEYGLCKRGTAFMQQRTSIVIGAMQKYNSPDKTTLFHMGCNFGLNSFLGAGLGFGTDFKKNSDKGLIYVNFKFNL